MLQYGADGLWEVGAVGMKQEGQKTLLKMKIGVREWTGAL